LAFTGGIVSLWLRARPLFIAAAVGFIALRVAVLNGLVLVTSIHQLRQNGTTAVVLEAAIHDPIHLPITCRRAAN
jgi:cobalt-zinc-cadmium resistance protein CzcA